MTNNYFHGDVWDLREIAPLIPRHRQNNRKWKLYFDKVENEYNKEIWKKYTENSLLNGHISLGTVDYYHRLIRDFLVSLGAKNIDKVTFMDVKVYAEGLDAKNLSPRTYNSHISVLGGLFEYLKAWEYQITNHFNAIGQKKIKRFPPSVKEVDEKLISKILSQVHILPIRVQIMLLLIYLGLEISYTLAIEIDACLSAESGIYKLRYFNNKRRDYDYIIIPESLYFMIEEYIKKLKDSGHTYKYLFPHFKDINRHETGDVLERGIKKILTELGEKQAFKLIGFRNYLLLRLLRGKVSGNVIQDKLNLNSSYTVSSYEDSFNEKGLHEVADSFIKKSAS